MDEQRVTDAGKPLQNGHGCNKGEELQLEDANDNNNDEVSVAEPQEEKKKKKKKAPKERSLDRSDRRDQCVRA